MFPLCFEPQPLLQKGSKAFGLHPCKSPRLLSLVIRRYYFWRDHFWVNFGRFARNGHKPHLPLISAPRLRAPLDQGKGQFGEGT